MNNQLYIPSNNKQKTEVCKITKVGGLNKAKRIIQVLELRENLEMSMMKLAAIENKKVVRSEAQRNERRAKR